MWSLFSVLRRRPDRGVERDAAPGAARSLFPTVMVPGAGGNILVVGSDSTLLETLFCSQLGKDYNIYTASDIVAAEDVLEEIIPDIIICDTDAGVAGSYAFCSRLKSAPVTAPVPLMIISRNPAQEARVEAFDHGAEAFFLKPIPIEEVVAQIRSLLANRGFVRESLSGSPSRLADTDFLDNLERIMRERMDDEALDVDSLAEEACMSSSSLFKKLKAMSGMSPGEYITAARMKEAASLLKDTALTVDDISIKVGFRSHSYFSTCFRKHFGTSPTKYRQLSAPSNGL